jgi:hypothetical protein
MASVASQLLTFQQRGPLSGTHRAGNISNTNSTGVSFSGVSIGDPDAYRTVILVSQADSFTDILSLSVGGTTIPSNQIIFNSTNTQAIGWLAFPTGSTTTISGTYTFNVSATYRHIYRYTILQGFRTIFDSAEGTSENLNLPGDESYIVGIGGGTTSSVSWTGLTTRQSVTSSASSIVSSASSTFVTSGTSRTVGVSSGTFLAASFR